MALSSTDSDAIGGGQVPECITMMQSWIEEMGAYVKALDPHHLVTVGAEGFWAPGAAREEANPGGWALQSGQNFSVNHAPSTIDFAAIHVWPDNWERCARTLHATVPALPLLARGPGSISVRRGGTQQAADGDAAGALPQLREPGEIKFMRSVSDCALL